MYCDEGGSKPIYGRLFTRGRLSVTLALRHRVSRLDASDAERVSQLQVSFADYWHRSPPRFVTTHLLRYTAIRDHSKRS